MTGWMILAPEIVLACTLGVLLLADFVLPAAQRRWLPWVVLLGTAVALALVWIAPGGMFGEAFSADGLARFFKTIILAALLALVLMAWDFEHIWGRPTGEFLLLLAASALGMLFIVSGQELILLYVGLELSTFPLVLATAYRPADPKSAEGGLKYLIMAALGAAILLFGFSLLYAATGTTELVGLAEAVANPGARLLLLLGVLCVLAGIGFKLALVPFHMWAPDAYEGAPTPVAAFLSVASKTAGFALAIRVLAIGLPAVRPEWGTIMAVLAAASMTLGNFAAIPQRNLKRMLAYSSIAQAGYMAMGLVAYQIPGLSALLFYLAAYLVTNLAAFAVVLAVERHTGSCEMEAFAGLARTSPRLALIMLLALLSLAGIPPLAGFTAKFYLFAAVFGQGYIWLVVVAVLNSALSLYYYLRVVRMIYIQPPSTDVAGSVHIPVPLAILLAASLIGILLLGVQPGPFVEAARAALGPLF